MDLDQLRSSDQIIFECVAGSHAYGTNTETSDRDYRGIFVLPNEEYLKLASPPEQITDGRQDIVFYSLKRFFELAQAVNPNIIELLWMPEDTTIIEKDVFKLIKENRHLFISKKAYHSFSGYSYSQIHKAKGNKKRINNPQPERRPNRLDYCFVIPYNKNGIYRTDPRFPGRPIQVYSYGINLGEFHVAALEHTLNMYRLYHYGPGAKGVFRGTDMLVCESIPIEDEVNNFWGFLIYDKDAYERDLREWTQYWDWIKNRNASRWEKYDGEVKFDYDHKNMAHCMRLLLSGESILCTGEPIVRLTGESLKRVMDIRNGVREYDDLLAEVETRMERLTKLYDESQIPHAVNYKLIEALYHDCMHAQKIAPTP
jgi:uncharacterized protein